MHLCPRFQAKNGAKDIGSWTFMDISTELMSPAIFRRMHQRAKLSRPSHLFHAQGPRGKGTREARGSYEAAASRGLAPRHTRVFPRATLASGLEICTDRQVSVSHPSVRPFPPRYPRRHAAPRRDNPRLRERTGGGPMITICTSLGGAPGERIAVQSSCRKQPALIFDPRLPAGEWDRVISLSARSWISRAFDAGGRWPARDDQDPADSERRHRRRRRLASPIVLAGPRCALNKSSRNDTPVHLANYNMISVKQKLNVQIRAP